MLAVGVILFTAIAGVLAQSGGPVRFDEPTHILDAVKQRGAKEVSEQANADWQTMHRLLKQIATGQKAWLDVALALRPGASGSVNLLLQYAVGEALGHAPENVLKIAGDETFPLLDVCGIPDTDDFRFDSYAGAKAELQRRMLKIKTVSGELRPTAEKCLEILQQTEAQLAQFFHVEPPAAQ